MRKQDRNGHLICLITYKHLATCEYAIKLFNGINLFGQPLKVQQSQQGGSLNRSDSLTNKTFPQQQQQLANRLNRNNSENQISPLPLLQNPLQNPQNNLISLMMSINPPLNNDFGSSNSFMSPQQFQHNQQYLRSSSVNKIDEYDNNDRRQSRRGHFDNNRLSHGRDDRRNDFRSYDRHEQSYSRDERDQRGGKRSRSRERSKNMPQQFQRQQYQSNSSVSPSNNYKRNKMN